MRKASSLRRVAVLVALTGIFGVGSCVTPIGPLRDSRGLLLVVRGDYGPGTEIYAMRPDGSQMQRLTQNNVLDSHPDWSPDGERIVFVSHPDSNPGQSNRRPDIFVMNKDGSEMRRLFQSSSYASHPSWSPDGRRIVFQNYDLTLREDRLYVMDADGSNVRQIPSAAGPNFWPEWSPDGTQILFLSSRPPRGLWTMYIVNADGTGERQLSDDSVCLSHISVPKWTPDGSRIGFLCEDEGGIYTVRADGTDRRLLIPSRAGDRSYEYAAVWSPDASQVAFASDRDTPEDVMEPAWHIFVASASGSGITRITSDDAGYHVTDWGPAR